MILSSMFAITMIATAPLMNSCNKDEQVVEASELQLSETSLTVGIGQTFTLTATVVPENAADKSISWTSSAPDIAEVDANGKIFAKSKGQAEITAMSKNGKTAVCKVTVVKFRINSEAAKDGYMVLETQKKVGEQIGLQMRVSIADGNADGDKVWIDLNNDGIQQPEEKAVVLSGGKGYTLGAKTVIIYGKVTFLGCADQKINALDVGQNTALEKLNCSENQLTALNVGRNKALRLLFCEANQIKKEAINALLETLPQRSVSDKAEIYIKNENYTKKGNELPDPAKITEAKNKNWKVFKWVNNEMEEL